VGEIFVVASTSQTTWPPQKKAAYEVGALVRAKWGEDEDGRDVFQIANVTSVAVDGYCLELADRSDSGVQEQTSVPVSEIEGEVQHIMRLVERLSRARDDFIFGYDWNDSSAFDQRDMQSEGGRAAVNWGDKQSVWRSYYFKGWCERIKAEMLVLAQLGYKIVLVCIEGGPITQREREVMPTLVEEIKGDLAMKQISCDVLIYDVSFDDFRQRFGLTRNPKTSLPT
jgi:hypothetical protein